MLLCCVRGASGQDVPPQKIADGVWFLLGDSSKGYSNTTVIEMDSYLIVVDANYPGRAKELLTIVKGLVDEAGSLCLRYACARRSFVWQFGVDGGGSDYDGVSRSGDRDGPLGARAVAGGDGEKGRCSGD